MSVKLELYRVFKEVAEAGNITAAAQNLFISQSAVSQSVKQLESDLQTRLFARNSRGVSLTPDGKMLYEYVRSAMGLLETGEEKLSQSRQLQVGHLTIGASVALISMVLGMLIGLLASYYRALDNVLMRICDGLSAIPSTLLAIALMAMLGSGTTNLIISLTVVSTPRLARIARSAALVVREQTYIEAMRATGASSMRIIWRHIAPNILSPVVVQASYIFANAIITEAALSFLGVGVPIPDPSWGNILNEGKAVIYKAWWMIVFPGIFTALTVLGLNVFGDGLRDVLDPHTN